MCVCVCELENIFEIVLIINYSTSECNGLMHMENEEEEEKRIIVVGTIH